MSPHIGWGHPPSEGPLARHGVPMDGDPHPWDPQPVCPRRRLRAGPGHRRVLEPVRARGVGDSPTRPARCPGCALAPAPCPQAEPLGTAPALPRPHSCRTGDPHGSPLSWDWRGVLRGEDPQAWHLPGSLARPHQRAGFGGVGGALLGGLAASLDHLPETIQGRHRLGEQPAWRMLGVVEGGTPAPGGRRHTHGMGHTQQLGPHLQQR